MLVSGRIVVVCNGLSGTAQCFLKFDDIFTIYGCIVSDTMY